MKIEMLKTVRPDWPFGKPGTILREGNIYEAKKNKNGAVTGLSDNGEWLGVKPDEFVEVEIQDEKFKIHELKTLPDYFELVRKGVKNFEVRKNDRDFKVGDYLFLKEWNGKYTGRDQRRKIGYILDNKDYCKEGYVILGFDLFYNML